MRYTKTLLIKCPGKLRAAGVGKDCWIQTFSRITQLEIDVPGRALMVILEASLTPFYGLSPFIKSLCIASNYLLPETFGLIYSFPLLEDLSVVVNDLGDILLESRRLVATQPSSPPPLTGTLKLCVLSGTDAIPSTLLSLPSGLHFRKLYLKGGYHNASTCTWGTALVEKCRDTLESIEIRAFFRHERPN